MGAVAVAQRPAIGRRGAAVVLIIAAVLAAGAAFAANAYIAGEAEKVAAPVRAAWVVARDIPAGTLLVSADLVVARFPIPGEMTSAYMSGDQPAQLGITMHALRKGQPILAGALLPAESADTVSPLVPLTVTVGGSSQRTVGALNIPLGRLAAPPPPFREGDHVDIWVQPVSASGTFGSLTLVLENIEVIAFGDDGGIVIAATRDQLERFVTASNQGSPMILTVRSSRRE